MWAKWVRTLVEAQIVQPRRPGAWVFSNVVPAAVNLAGPGTWALPGRLGPGCLEPEARDQPGCQDGHGTQWAGALGMGGYMYPVTRSRAPGNKNNDSRYIARFMLRQSVAVILVLLTENGPAPGIQHGHATRNRRCERRWRRRFNPRGETQAGSSHICLTKQLRPNLEFGFARVPASLLRPQITSLSAALRGGSRRIDVDSACASPRLCLLPVSLPASCSACLPVCRVCRQ